MANTTTIEVDPDVAKTPSKSDPPSKNGVQSKGETPSKSKRKSISIPYTELIHTAIVALKDRTGSSAPAITKWIMNNHPTMDPAKLKQKMNFTLKLGVKSKRFVKIKSSFKINPVYVKNEQKKKAAANAKKRKATALANAKADKAAKKAAAAAKPPTKAELAALKEKERKEKAEREKQKKEKDRQERIRKRKFPMDDLKLIEEDRELKVVSPCRDNARPSLELAMPNYPSACRSDTMGSGIMNDVIHIYHFFRGDLGWGRFKKQKSIVAPFSLNQWMECVQLVSKGWCKKAKMLPPLMTHLFVVALQYLVPEKLSVALTPASWSEVLLLYMDAMEQKYTDRIPAEEGKTTIRSLGIDAEYLFFINDEPKDSSELDPPTSNSSYLGTGILKKAHSKFVNTDPWQLSAEELLSLLKALVDDILGTCRDCAEELEIRNDETYELLKRKKAADAQCRKFQTAHNRQLAAEAAEEKEKQKAIEAAIKGEANGEEKVEVKKPEKVTRSSSKASKISEAKLEKVRREQQKAQDAYDKSVRSKRIRTEPAGMDRNFQEVYHCSQDPEFVFFLQQGKPIQTDLPFKIPDSKPVRRISWQAIKKKSTLNQFMESLDVRGIREANLHEALQLARRHVYDDIKEANDKKALLREKSDVKRRLENARTNYQSGRKSGRLASQSEQELIDLQEEIERLEKSVEEGNVVEEYDLELETGLEMLRNFETQEEQTRKRRANRREVRKAPDDEDKRVKKLPCSKLWPTGHIDGTGIVGFTVSQLLELEERVENLSKWETGDRKAWISSLETAIHAWNEGSLPFLFCDETTLTNNGGSPSSVIASPEPKSKKQHNGLPSSYNSNAASSQNSALSTYQIVCMIRQRLLELENRIFEATGLAMVAKETDEADENMSTSPEDEEERIQDAWKKQIHRLRRIPAKAYTKIHTVLVDAISAARKTQNTVVVAELKHALVEYHPEAASYCKEEALQVLEKHGGYEEDTDDESVEDANETNLEKGIEDQTKTKIDYSDISNCLCAEAIILNSSLDGHEDASRVDWIRAVKQTRTVSKQAAFISAFVQKANAKITKMEEENSALIDAMGVWIKSRPKKKKTSHPVPELSEVWANVNFSEEFCFVKVEEYPMWPARKCIPKDGELTSQLELADRLLVSLVGERGALRVVKTENCIPFSDTPPEEDISNHPRDIRNQLEEAMNVARRVVRGQQKKKSKSKKIPINSIK